MPTRNVNLTEELDRFVLTKVESGRYENASEVVRAALRTLEREEEQYEAKLVALRAAIDEGDASGIDEGNAFARVRKKLRPTVTSASLRLVARCWPTILMLGRPCDDIRPGLRRMEHGKHVVFYRLQKPGGILVVRILHQRMLPEKQAIG
jgi:antitoxin ParD1/3/4